MKKFLLAAGLVSASVLAAARYIPRPGPVGNRSVPQPARSVDIERYMGRWYEQFRYEASGRHLWALTRAPLPGSAMLAMLEARVKALRYDWSLVRMTRQPAR